MGLVLRRYEIILFYFLLKSVSCGLHTANKLISMPCIVEEELIANDVDFRSQLTKSWMYYYNSQVIKEGEVSSSERLSSPQSSQ